MIRILSLVILMTFIVNYNTPLFAQITQTDTSISVDPTNTYLRTYNDPATDAVPININHLGLTAGDQILLQQLGDWDNGPNGDTSTRMIGVFSKNDTLLEPSLQHRVPGAVDAGIDDVTPPTYYGDYDTDIEEDFEIDSIIIQVPDSAVFLFVCARDSWFNDNSDPDGDFEVKIRKIVTQIDQPGSTIPKTVILSQNYPNPFNPETTIEFSLPAAQTISLSVYDALGRKIKTLINKQHMLPAAHQVTFNSGNLPGGIYFYRLQAGEFVKTRKMLLLK